MSFSVRSRKISEKTDDPFVVDSQESMKEDNEKKNSVYKKEPVWLSLFTDYVRVGLLSSLSYYLRTMKLGYPPFAIDAELELTRQVNWYMEGKFFIGKFPPLVGIVYSFLARLVGYYGTAELHYAEQPFAEFPLVALRRVSALLGASLIPLSYFTMRNLGHSRSAATMAAGLVMLENGLITQSRFATPDIFVLFFGALASYSWTVMQKYSQESKSLLYSGTLTWQAITGVSLGCALSSKWTGLLATLIVWSLVVGEMWSKLCDRRNKVMNTLKRLALYTFMIGVLPLFVYYGIFFFHLLLTPRAGDHDLLVSPKLKYSLIGNDFEPTQPNIAYGSRIIIRHDGSVGGYLHSHKKRFSGGSTQQEVTVYPHEDINNIWTVQRIGELYNSSQPVDFVRNTDQIRLEHFASTRKLHSHDHRPQLTNKKEHNEVTAYGDKYINDSHDYWILQILDEDNLPSKNKNITWKSLSQKFRLQHIRGCHLISHNAYYTTPEGENHQEATCMVSAGTHISAWTVESAYHEQLEKIEHISHDKMSKFEMFKEVHKSMWNYPSIVYNRLQPISTSDGAYNIGRMHEETPSRWFFKRVGLRMWSKLSGFSAHLVLNSVVQRLTLFTMTTYLGFLALNAFLSKRQIKLPRYLSWLNFTGLDVMMNDFYTRSVAFFYGAIIIHLGFLKFLPAHTLNMSDILGSMYYGSGLIAVTFEAFTARLPAVWRRSLIYGILVLTLFKFSSLSHLAYGGEMWYRVDCENAGIDIDCYQFPPHETELAEIRQNSGSTVNSTQKVIYVELPGSSQPFRYQQGQEAEADGHLAALKQSAFMKEAHAATGALRYHRVLPTPGLQPEQAAAWAKENTDYAEQRNREMEQAKAEQEAKEKAEKEQAEREKAEREQAEKENTENEKPKEGGAAENTPAEPINQNKLDALREAADRIKQKNREAANAA